MTTVVTVKLTPAELKALSFLDHVWNADSRSEVLRSALIKSAKQLGLPPEIFREITEERTGARPRRSAALCRLIGPRQTQRQCKPKAS